LFVVNCVSKAGKHLFVDHWISNLTYKNGKVILYELSILDLRTESAQKMFKYVCGVLDSLGVLYGPSHTEVMMTDEGEVVLIEMGARMMGMH